ncbi:MAG TPA: adenylate/guanylate cyclase domain-containing protein [Turneriella sp.]|nr:adenylate/guanylate cyclase domain-containing protein [Turneriella sp.]
MPATILSTPRPVNEDDRLQALKRYDILDSEKEQLFDDLTRLAADMTGSPVSLITLVDKDRVWIKSNVGLDIPEMPREGAFCSHTILGNDSLIIKDAKTDPRFASGVAEAEQAARFYAGTPLTTRDGYNLGSLCVLDLKPREISDEALARLKMLARQAMAQIELRHNLAELAKTTRKAISLENLIRQYTSRSVWERADMTVETGGLEIRDEEVNGTYLFLDVVGFTSLSEKLGPSGTVDLLNAYFRPIVDIVFEQGGDIDKFVGDQLFCIFQDSARAVETATEIRTMLEKLNQTREAAGQKTLAFTMGLNAGLAVRANVGGINRRDNTLIGNAVNIAARLQKACRPGGILVSNALFEKVKGGFHSVQQVKLNLKNLAESVNAHYIERGVFG